MAAIIQVRACALAALAAFWRPWVYVQNTEQKAATAATLALAKQL